MKKMIGLTLVGMLSLALAAPVHANGGRGGGFQGGNGGMHSTSSRHGGGSQHNGGFRHNGGFQHRGNFQRGCCFGGAFFGWPVTTVVAAPYYSSPYSYPAYQDPGYAPSPYYQQQPQLYMAPPVPSEMCYTGGCYRLQGDGVSIPFRWVWIPAAPEGPPAPPPAAAPGPGAFAPSDSASRPIQQLYRWVDDQGVANWTNNREAVPERFRPQLKQTL